MEYVISSFFWLVMAMIVAFIADSKGRNWFGWALYGFIIWPIALVHVLATTSSQAAQDRMALESGAKARCPQCAELIRREAKVCPHCQRDLPEGWPPKRLRPRPSVRHTPRRTEREVKPKPRRINIPGSDW